MPPITGAERTQTAIAQATSPRGPRGSAVSAQEYREISSAAWGDLFEATPATATEVARALEAVPIKNKDSGVLDGLVWVKTSAQRAALGDVPPAFDPTTATLDDVRNNPFFRPGSATLRPANIGVNGRDDINAPNGLVTDFYSGQTLPRDQAFGKGRFNTEHLWPSSVGPNRHRYLKGSGDVGASTDWHHLVPARIDTNSRRASIPFGDVVNVERSMAGGKASLGTDAAGRKVFEPGDDVKGNVARAMLYVHAVYGAELSKEDVEQFVQWDAADPVDAEERRRNQAIAKAQGNVNPFVEYEGLAAKVFED
ncbi:MAG: endonuclease [Myxococcaceae bacterium]|nr:endonuclease [Myxococcaceae bacterium]